MQEPERFHSQAYLNVLDDSASECTCFIGNAGLESMLASCARHYPHEACGLLLGAILDAGWEIDETKEVSNLNHERATDRFVLDPAAYQAVDRELRGSGREIIGIYHSHPDCPARPSPTDLANAWDGFAYIIVSTLKGRAAGTHCWTLNRDGDRFQSVNLQVLPEEKDQ